MCETLVGIEALQRRFDRRAEDRASIGFCYFDRHVQSAEGEVFLFNASEEEFEAIELKTKRLGGIAFNFQGIPFAETRRLYSVFAQRSEVEELGINCRLPESVA